MSRFALFTVALLVIVAIGSKPRTSGKSTLESMCVCVPARAGLLVKSAIARTRAEVRSVGVSTSRAALTE